MYVCMWVCMSALNLPNRLSQGYQTWRAQPLGGVDCHAPLEIFFGPPLGGATVVPPPCLMVNSRKKAAYQSSDSSA